MAFGLNNPTVGGSNDTWGDENNNLWDKSYEWAQRGQATFDIVAPDNDTSTLVINSRFPFDIEQLTYQTDSGSATVEVQINGVAVTGLSALPATTTEQTASATGANSVAIGDNVTLVVSLVAGDINHLLINLWGLRTGEGAS